MRQPPAETRILVIRAGQLGDTVFATAVMEPLRAAYGTGAVIDWVVKSGMEGLFAHDPRVGRVFGVAHRTLPVLVNADLLRVVWASWQHPYEVVLNLEMGAKFLGLVRLVRATRKFGRPSQLIADDQPAEHAVAHVRRLCELTVAADIAQTGAPDVRPGDVAAARTRLGLDADYLVLNPTNSHFRKQDHRTYRAWPIQHWRELLDRLVKERPETVVLIGSGAEMDYFRQLEPLPPGVVSLVGRTSLSELATVLAGARALITSDTGPSHLAAAVGTPVVAMFGPSDHRKTGPFATPDNVVRILRAGLDCSPCVFTERLRACPENRCMQLVTPGQVLAELDSILQPV